jgi:hypothetical protein
MGRDLARTGLGQRATIAVSAAGAIAYYSGFRAIDLGGLADPFLSGREAHTVAEAWEHVERFRPDAFQSALPPATPGVRLDQYDPMITAPAFWRILRDHAGSELPKYWDQGRLLETMRREAIYLRERYTFGAAYGSGQDLNILYLRRDSPYLEIMRRALRSSAAGQDRTTDLGPLFGNDPRKL